MNRDLLDKISSKTDNLDVGLFCVFCEKILFHPQQFNCVHRACKLCIKAATQRNEDATCPKCNVVIEDFQYDYATLREINDLVVCCPMKYFVYRDKVAKFSEHISNCFLLEEVCDQNVLPSRSKQMDINQEIIEMKKNIGALMTKNDQIHQLTNECRNLRTMIYDAAQRNEKGLKDLKEEMQNTFQKMESSFVSVNSTNPYTTQGFINLRNELKVLQGNYESLEEYMDSLNQFNTKIKDSVTNLYTTVQTIDEKRKSNFHQFCDDIEYLTNEFSIIKTTNEKKVVKFYNKLSRHSDKLNKLAKRLPELYETVNNFRVRMKDVIENHVEYEPIEITDLEKQMSDVDKEIDSVRATVNNLQTIYPNSVFITVHFQDKVGMNMSLAEAEIFCHQFDSTMVAVKKEMIQVFGSNRSSVIRKRQLMRRPAFTMSDRKRRSGSRNIDEI